MICFVKLAHMPDPHANNPNPSPSHPLDDGRLPPKPIDYRVGDATRPIGGDIKIIVHVCNDVGAWGRGFVVALSKRWSEPERMYRAWHRGDLGSPFELGEVQFVKVSFDIVVANMIGQHSIRSIGTLPPIRYDAIRSGLKHVAHHAQATAASIHMPRIGCGLAGGTWSVVERLITEELLAKGLPVTVYDL